MIRQAESPLEELRARLLKRCMSAEEVEALIDELSAHVEDVRLELESAGVDPRETTRLAYIRVGSADALEAAILHFAWRRRPIGKFPLLSSIFLPVLILSVLLGGLVGGSIVIGRAAALGFPASPTSAVYTWTVLVINCCGAMGALLLCAIFRHSLRRRGWTVLACLVLAFLLAGIEIFVSSGASSIMIGLTLPPRFDARSLSMERAFRLLVPLGFCAMSLALERRSSFARHRF